MRMDEPAVRRDRKMHLLSPYLHQQDVAGTRLAPRDSPEEAVKRIFELTPASSAQRIIAPHRPPIEAERCDDHADTVDAIGVPPLRPKARADERSRALGMGSRHSLRPPDIGSGDRCRADAARP